MSESTYLTQEDVDLCVAFSGHELKEFYSYFINQNEHSPYGEEANGFDIDDHTELKDHVLKFCADRTQLIVDKLVKNGEGADAHIFPVRIEVRTDKDMPGASQIATRGIYKNFRKITLEHFASNESLKNRALTIKMSGQMSFEINVKGVDKGLGLHYLSKNFDFVLDQMGYKAGSVIDARQNPMVIAADADGTTYGLPSTKGLPTLEDSAAFDEIMSFLKLGGIFVVISGNKMERTLERIVNSVPRELRSNVIVVANGAADMAVVGEDGQFSCLPDYREHALKSLEGENKLEGFNVIYLGDDGRQFGNDFPAFEAVGFDRSILVCGEDKAIDSLKKQCVGGFEEGTKKVIGQINQDIQNNNQSLEFSDSYISEMIAQW